jgi:hypothetical protein
MANEFFNNRVAMGTFSFPANVAASTSVNLSQSLDGLYIPSNAIVTRVGYILGAQTEIASMKNGTMNISVSNIPIHSNNVIASVALSVGAVKTGTMADAAGIFIGTGGVPVMHFASSDNARSGINVAGTVHIGYIAKDLGL